MHFTSHKALIKSPGEHGVAMETSQQRADTNKAKHSAGSGCSAAAAEPN